jgi:hypothetical protein
MIVLLLIILAEFIWSPRLDYIKESKMLLLHYTAKNTRKYLVLWK